MSDTKPYHGNFCALVSYVHTHHTHLSIGILALWLFYHVWFCNILHWSSGKYCFTISSSDLLTCLFHWTVGNLKARTGLCSLIHSLCQPGTIVPEYLLNWSMHEWEVTEGVYKSIFRNIEILNIIQTSWFHLTNQVLGYKNRQVFKVKNRLYK